MLTETLILPNDGTLEARKGVGLRTIIQGGSNMTGTICGKQITVCPVHI
jgi:hypothetical protein